MTVRLVVVGPQPDTARWEAHAAAQGLQPEYHPDFTAALGALAGGAGLAALVRAPALIGLDLAAEAARAAADPGLAGISWLALASDGIGADGSEIDNGSYADHAGLAARFPHRALVAGDPAVTLVDVGVLARVGEPAAVDGGELAQRGWDAGLPSYVSPHLRFAFPGTRAEYQAHRRVAGAAPEIGDALRAARPDPTITVAIRSALRRPAMLARAAASVAAQGDAVDRLLLLGTAAGVADAAAGIGAEPLHVPGSRLPPRAALVHAAFDATATDYLWFLDDDDELAPGAAAAARAAVHASERPLVVGASVAVEEHWPPGASEPATAAEIRRWDPRAWTGAFTGWMPVPFPSLVVPVEVARSRLADVAIRVGHGEDYALLLALLTAPGMQVVTTEALFGRVSIRPGGDNVVTATDRTDWVRAASTMLGDVAADRQGGGQPAWALGERVRDSVPIGDLPTAAAEPPWRVRLKRLVPPALHPAARQVLTRVRGREHLDEEGLAEAVSGKVLLMPAVSYHAEELLPLAAELAAAGAEPAFLVSDHRWPTTRAALRGAGFPVYRCLPPGAWVEAAAALLTMNDWAEIYRDVIVAANEAGVPTFGKVEGVQDFHDDDTGRARRPYRTVAHVLGQGENDREALAGADVAVVGSSRLERMWLAPPRPPGAELAVVNYNFTYGVLAAAAERWLESAIAGCKAAGMPYVVSVHPASPPLPAGVAAAAEPVGELLQRAAVLVSRFSTVPFEAMARGVPFVYHNPHGERVPTFKEPDGAFDISTDAAGLAEAIAASAPWRDGYRERCAQFFLRQVDVQPGRTPAERGAEAILAQVGAHR